MPKENAVDDDTGPDRAPPGRGPLWLWLLGGAVALGALLWWLVDSFGTPGGDGESVYLTHHLIWLAVLGAALVVQIRARPGTALKQAAVWILIGAGLVLAYSFRDDAGAIKDRIVAELLPYEGRVDDDGQAVVFRRARGGHFIVEADVDGVDMRFLVDTGASEVVLSPADAERLGFDLDRLRFDRVFITANGRVKAASVMLAQVAIGPIAVHNVRAAVNGVPMDGSLLGMSFLDRIGGYRVERDTLTLLP
jgi:aspartyl protease family protein